MGDRNTLLEHRDFELIGLCIFQSLSSSLCVIYLKLCAPSLLLPTSH